MKDIESRLRQPEVINQEQGNYQNMQKMKENLSSHDRHRKASDCIGDETGGTLYFQCVVH